MERWSDSRPLWGGLVFVQSLMPSIHYWEHDSERTRCFGIWLWYGCAARCLDRRFGVLVLVPKSAIPTAQNWIQKLEWCVVSRYTTEKCCPYSPAVHTTGVLHWLKMQHVAGSPATQCPNMHYSQTYTNCGNWLEADASGSAFKPRSPQNNVFIDEQIKPFIARRRQTTVKQRSTVWFIAFAAVG